MTDQHPNSPGLPREGGGSHRNPLSGSSLVLVLFVLAALPPATFAEGLQPQAVLELLGSSHDVPRREAPRELRAVKGWVGAATPSKRPWVGPYPIGVAESRSLDGRFGACVQSEVLDIVGLVSSRRAHIRWALHDLPPPARA